ncbi:MAG: TIGR04084 family radical SAM/SPASM domain-containing protein [Candidatus Heimdallarchaeaceae archaeon]
MNWFIITSTACNLKCKYCLNEPHPLLPIYPSWKIEQLKKFLEQDIEPSIAFYGGEPLLNLSIMTRIMDEIVAKHYTIQTNGLLLHKIPTKYLNKFSTILVSIDGNKVITDFYRGEGVFDKIKENIKNIRQRGFKGDLIARMAVSEKANIFEDVTFLLNSTELTFNHVHWQLDVEWDEGMETRWENFPEWVERYNQGITKLVDYWLKEMKKGKVQGIVPFLGIFRHILFNTKTSLPCQAGLTSFGIRTDGKLMFCPLPPEYEMSVVGDMKNSNLEELKNCLPVAEPCPSCEYFDLCGGRCLFANLYKLWGEEGFNLVCKTVKHLIDELRKIKPQVNRLIEEKIIQKEEFLYPTYNNTTEIIP